MAVGSIVDYLKSSGKDSSYAGRKKLAEQYGVSGYSGTAAQNTALLRQLQGGGAPAASQPAPPPNVMAGTGANTPQPQASSSRPTYTQSDKLNGAYNELKNWENNRPDEYDSQYSGQIDDILNSILNREKFSYDMNADPLYQQYKDSYMRQGNLAMRDTMGNASALTGGYGSTYAQTAGSQAYDQQLGKLNDRIPELYNLAYGMYQNEGQELYNQLGAVKGLDDTQYGRYRDDVSDYYTDRGYYYGKANDMYNQEYGQYLNNSGFWDNDRNFDYQKQQDAQGQENWQKEFDYQKQMDAAQLALQRARSSGGGSGGSKSGTSKSVAKLMGKGNAGYAPIAAGIFDKVQKNGWSNMQAYKYVMELGQSGEIKPGQIDDILKAVNIDEDEALKELEEKDKILKQANLTYPVIIRR